MFNLHMYKSNFNIHDKVPTCQKKKKKSYCCESNGSNNTIPGFWKWKNSFLVIET